MTKATAATKKPTEAEQLDPKQLCMELVQTETEAGVIGVLKKYGFWDADSAWVNYGGKENNFSDIGNQKESADDALVEKIVNSVDAMLLAKCSEQEINPESSSAPASISDGLQKFFGIRGGKLTNLGNAGRAAIAQNICLVATGKKLAPNYIVVDQGIGQAPSQFPSTFLSLTESNKLRIQFVQGKFNMGSTGVLQFCGERNLQLIVSKKHPSARKGIPDGEMWGFTVVRREPPKDGMKSSVYKYLAPGGTVLAFQAGDLPLLPGEYPEAYQVPLEYGTFVKMYEYDIGPSLRTNILFDLYNRLSLLTPTIALPVRLFERRKGYTGHSMETTMAGLTVRLEEDTLDNLETGWPASSTFTVGGTRVKAQIYAFKPGKRAKYAKSDGVIFTQYGQTHGSLDNNFFRRNKVGMSYLADSILVIVDCTDIDGATREDLFMNSRDRLRKGKTKNEIERRLEEIIGNHKGLKRLREERKKAAIQNKLGDAKPLADVIERVLKSSPSLAKLLGAGVRITSPFDTSGGEPTVDFEGKRFPTVFALSKKYPKEKPKACELGRRFRVTFTTDAVNDYFDRDDSPGDFSLWCDGQSVNDFTLNLWDGKAHLSVTLPKRVSLGSTVRLKASVIDDSRVEPLAESFWITVTEKNEHGGGLGKSKPPSKPSEKDKEAATSQLGLPRAYPVMREEWPNHNFDQYSALRAVHSGTDNNYDFFYNIDNAYLLAELKSAKDESAEVIKSQFETGLVLIGLAILRAHKDKKSSEEEVNVEDVIATVSAAIAPILVPMIRTLGGLSDDQSGED